MKLTLTCKRHIGAEDVIQGMCYGLKLAPESAESLEKRIDAALGEKEK